ncbi:hypothetical protein K1719_017617 [Acacia pycnantha]|nr:hypothetical protein K1719_017617 [Acacia pycnantha]
MNIQECAIQSQWASRHYSGSEYHKSEVSDVSIVSAASALCSLSDPLESYSSTTKNDEGRANSGIVNSEELCEGVSNIVCESLASLTRGHDSSIKPQGGDLYGLEMKSMVHVDSDDSDSEIFWVKRPSSLKAERRNGDDGMGPKHSDHQGLKRLKKNCDEGRSGQLIGYNGKSSESSCNKWRQPANHKIDGESCTRERYAKVNNGIPISIRYKKLGNEDLSGQGDHRKSNWPQQSIMEPSSPTEVGIGAKRLKVRGPSFPSL